MTEAAATFYLHGYGSSADEFRGYWARDAHSAAAVFLEGPEHDRFSSGRRWFAFTAVQEALGRGVSAAATATEARIGDTLCDLGLDAVAPISLIGHSQGAMVLLEILRRGRFRVTSARCYAAFLPRPQHYPESAASGDTVLHLFSSDGDRYIDTAEVEETMRFFRSLNGVDTHHYRARGLPHAFSHDWLDPSNFEEGTLT